MTGTGLLGGLGKQQAKQDDGLPPLRNFVVRVRTASPDAPVKEVTVAAHGVDCLESGALMFNIFAIIPTDQGPKILSVAPRGFAPGVWLDYEEQFVPAESGIIH